MNLTELLKDIKTNEDFVAFVKALGKDFEDNPSTWENITIGSFLEALARWTEDSEGYYKNLNQTIPQNQDWKATADMFIAAKHYE